MKRKLGYLLVGLLCIQLCACDFDPYAGKRPIDYLESQWYCMEYDLLFEVGGETTEYALYVSEESIPISLLFSAFDSRVIATFEYDGAEYSWGGNCKYGKKDFSISFDNEQVQDVFGRESVTLAFERMD